MIRTTIARMVGRLKGLFFGFFCLVSAAAAQSPETSGARDVVTEGALQRQAAAAPSLKMHLEARAKPVVAPAPAIQSTLWTSSIILSDGDMFTLVPIGSILHLPPPFRNRVLAAPQGDFTFWPDFLKRNEDWLAAHEVSLEMSRGDAKAAKTLLKGVAKDTRLLVATYKGSPLTILEPAPEEATGKEP